MGIGCGWHYCCHLDPATRCRHDRSGVLTFGFQMFLAGLPLLLIMIALALAPLAGILAYTLLDHVQSRVKKFLTGDNLQTERSIQSFVEGGWYGVGPGDGRVKLHLPDAHADFIFSVAAEEYGLIACLFLIGLFGFVVIRGYAQSLIAKDMFSMLAVSGLATQFGVQAAIHMASSLNLIPTKGMTLPFISYGGSRAGCKRSDIGAYSCPQPQTTPFRARQHCPP